jgi:aryl-alcohol dehydrogenase-like predicted oxidoreductase
MRYRRLGCTNLRVSVVGLGTWQFGGEWGRTYSQLDVDAIFNAARAAGIDLIDTAECYGDHESETLIGYSIQRDREKWIVCTKFGHRFTGIFRREEPRSPADVVEQLDRSLAALRTDYVDVLQYHSWGDGQFFDEDVLAALLKARDAGKFRHLGNSVRSKEYERQVEASKSRHVEVVQIVYNRLARQPEEAAFAHCIAQDLGVLARSPLASGWLSGKYRPGHTFAESDTRSRGGMTPEKHAELERARAEVPAGVEMATWALAWCLRHPAVSAVIPGCKDAQQVQKNAAAADLADFVNDDHPQSWGRADRAAACA